jgi:hypothetical protein
MNKICLAATTGAALMVVIGIANAQGTGTSPGSSGTASNQCWDMSSNMVREKSQTNASGTPANTDSTSGTSGTTDGTVGSTSPKRPMGTGAVGAGGPSAGAGPSSNASVRPAGIPDC